MMGSSFLSFLVTEESALLAMVIKCHRLLKDVVMKNIPERLHMKDVERCQISPHVICGEVSDLST